MFLGIGILNGLSALVEIKYLVVRKTSITDFSGLDNLTKVIDPFIIEFNDNLTSLTGLDPNPVSTEMTVNWQGGKEKQNFNIYNLMSRVVQKGILKEGDNVMLLEGLDQ